MALPKPQFAKWTRRERLAAAVGAIAVAIVLMDRLVIAPWWHHAQEISQKIGQKEEAMAQQHRLLSREAFVLARLDQYRSYLRPAGAEELDMAAMLKEIDALAQESQVSLGEVKPLPSDANDLYREYALEVHGDCSLQQWVHFVYLLESSRSLFTIEQAGLEASKDTPGRLQGSLRLTSMAMLADPTQAAKEKAAHAAAETE
ncbi:MAG: hypothetical protein HY597_06100 [Candidatus Omnitrophica bacterium]|nr:hypothetical protein [Candidatus Omnitrophota bacterium]